MKHPWTSLLIDLDGTLTDPKAGITRCIQHALRSLGHQAPETEALTWCIGPPLRDSFVALLGDADAPRADDALRFYRERFSTVGLYENELYPQVPEALARIQAAGVALFLATSKPEVYARRILDHFNLSRYFAGIHGATLDGGRTSKEDLVAYAVHHEGLLPEQTIMVGDRSFDVAGGKANGLSTGVVTYGYGTVAELQAADPDWWFNSPDDLAAFFVD